ncbi:MULTISPECIES: urease subunit beta [unclassified Polynucleobacter]|jgi:urease subunit beta|uniref:urease subunit beta n=1 Tax=unclassified Polynucleobacter TaxID=2640945 RepID=UPI001C0D5306|nr:MULTISPECIES: urease subunit beta [unclassified Polynucleobacter]MBU3563074.1 urease subunit beta [Polynucleobacter sp. Tro8-14-1]MBU3626337.1 urease subunit beta [Polynucleobacter sp. JS-Safj-400b-B2]
MSTPSSANSQRFIPGQMFVEPGDIELNVGRKTLSIEVSNSGDRPIQIGSHFHFFEVNDALLFDRDKTKGMRLNIVAGTAVRFEPGQKRTIELVEVAGEKKIYGFAGRVMGGL